MAKSTQTVMDVFKQKRIPALETQAQKFDTARSVRAEQKGLMNNAELKIREIMLANADKLDHQEDENRHKILVYELGDVKITCKTTEAVGVRIGKDTKGSIGEGGDANDEGGAE
jgi:hypothetical protein